MEEFRLNSEAYREEMRASAADRRSTIKAESLAVTLFSWASLGLIVGGLGGGIVLTLAGHPLGGLSSIIIGGLGGVSKIISAIKGKSSDDR